MARTFLVALAGIGVILAAGSVRAHHSFSAEFDANAPVTLSGAITKTQWINPHAWIHIEVKRPDGALEEWMIEGGTPNELMRRGVGRDTLKLGTLIVVSGFQAKDGSRRANGRDITYPDGKKMMLGSSGTGAPYEKELRK